ncbi:MAG: hypothetical protein Q8N81_02120 [bacterium]|nr:hypothetical protein [bacterium]
MFITSQIKLRERMFIVRLTIFKPWGILLPRNRSTAKFGQKTVSKGKIREMKNGKGQRTEAAANGDVWIEVPVTADPHKLGALKRCTSRHLRTMAEAKTVMMRRNSATETGQRDNPYAVVVHLMPDGIDFSITSRYLGELTTAQRGHAGLPTDHANSRTGRRGWTDSAAADVFVAGATASPS